MQQFVLPMDADLFLPLDLEVSVTSHHIDPENLGTELTATRFDSPGFISPLYIYFL